MATRSEDGQGPKPANSQKNQPQTVYKMEANAEQNEQELADQASKKEAALNRDAPVLASSSQQAEGRPQDPMAGRPPSTNGNARMEVQINAVPARVEPPANFDDMDEGVGTRGFDANKYRGTGAALLERAGPKAQEHIELQREPAAKPETIKQEEEYSLIKEGDSLVFKAEGQDRKPKPSAAMTVYQGQPITSGDKKPPTGPKSSYQPGEYSVSGNKNLLDYRFEQQGTNDKPTKPPTTSLHPDPTDPAHPQNPINHQKEQSVSKYAEKPEGDKSTKVVSDKEHSTNTPNHPEPVPTIPPQTQAEEKKSSNKSAAIQIEKEKETIQAIPEKPKVEEQPELLQKQQNVQPSPEAPTPIQPDIVEQHAPQRPETVLVSEIKSNELNDSNMANLNDSLEDSPAKDQDKKMETQSKLNNDFQKYIKDEGGMSILAPADIDYIGRAGKAEASLLRYDNDVRSKYEKVVVGFEQVFANIKRMNISAEESTNKFKRFFHNFLPRAETLAGLYPYKPSWGISEDRKDMSHLQAPGNFKQLQEKFELMKKQRADHSKSLVGELKALQLEYKSKIVEENFFEEGIDKKGTAKMQKDIEEAFSNIHKRNKKCENEKGEVLKKVTENKLYFEKNKKFKSDVFHDYMHYVRSVRKMWLGLSDLQKKLLGYWKRVRKVEEMRVQALSNLLKKYFAIEERLSSSTQNIKALLKMNETLSPEAVAASIYSDRALLTSPVLESVDIPTDSIEHFVESIEGLKNFMPDIVEFSLWDYINPHTLVKNVRKPLRIFRTIENYIFVYSVPDRREIPMEDPVYSIRVNNLVLQVDEKNNALTFKSNAVLNFASFTFNLRDHKDAMEVVGIVNKFASNTAGSSAQATQV